MGLYESAFKLDPNDFELARDLAQTYYGIKTSPRRGSLKAWTNAMNVATNDVERQGIYIHFARIHILSGHFAEAQQNLNMVT